MAQWRTGLRGLARDKGISAGELAGAEHDLLALLSNSRGDPFDFSREWFHFQSLTQALQGAAYERRWDDARAVLDRAREQWRQVSDRDVDWCCG